MRSLSGAVATISVSVGGTPVADAGSDCSGIVGEPVALDASASQGGNLQYSWTVKTKPAGATTSFSAAGSAATSFTGSAAGSYIVKLTILNDFGNDSDEIAITLGTSGLPPDAQASAPASAMVGEAIALDGSASGGTSPSFLWSVTSAPLGSTASLVNSAKPIAGFTPDLVGTYQFALTVSNLFGADDTASVSVNVSSSGTAPTAAAGADQSVMTGSVVTLDGGASAGTGNAYAWSLASKPAGSAAVLSSASAKTTSFTADLAGTYTATLTVSNAYGTASSDSVTITAVAAGIAPTADAGADKNAEAIGASVALDGSGSLGTDNSYLWTLESKPSGSSSSVANSTKMSASFTPDLAGSYVFLLSVSNEYGDPSTDSMTVIAGAPPAANAGADQGVKVGSLATLDASLSSGTGNS